MVGTVITCFDMCFLCALIMTCPIKQEQIKDRAVCMGHRRKTGGKPSSNARSGLHLRVTAQVLMDDFCFIGTVWEAVKIITTFSPWISLTIHSSSQKSSRDIANWHYLGSLKCSALATIFKETSPITHQQAKLDSIALSFLFSARKGVKKAA